MKINMPVTDHEVRLQEGQELVTKTDLKGVITYANPAFVEVSGFSAEELVGSNHNLVRHPDMPQAAFKDLWDTLQMGRPWNKLVKNRTKDGNYYWVKANVTPIFQNGQPIEYMSVRTAPSREEIDAAERLYAQLNNNQANIPAPSSIATADLASGLFKVAMVAVALMVVISGALFFSGVDKSLVALGPLAAFFVMLFGAMGHQQKKVIAPLKSTIEEIRIIGEGRYLHPVDVTMPGELGELRRAIKSLAVRMGFEVNDAKEQGNRSLRIKQALDNVNSNVMVADNDGYIIYMNEAVLGMMRKAESDIRSDLPEFSADRLLGANFDTFHKDPSHQRSMLSSLKETFRGKIVVGGRTFKLVANPVNGEQGERLGTVVEWEDITDQLVAEREIEQLIAKASKGDLEQRLDIEIYEGFMKNIATGVNQMLDAVVEPIMESKRVLTAMSEGDLSDQMRGEYHGAFADLNMAINDTLSKLFEMVGEIRGSGASIATGASEIAHGNATLSQRTEAQAASLEETAASMEEMTSTVRQNAQNAQHAKELAVTAKSMAVEGGEISDKVVSSMGQISQASTRIAEIIGVIDEIAFQTNLLALNAAVEAARAGEQGRGFAVVASEVRNLAQRSASAAKEIKDLIGDSVDKVEEGARYVDESGKALKNIMDGVDKVSDIIGEIANASQEQASGIEQVNSAVSQMDEGTQQNAALVEQVAAASESMEEQAQQMQKLVNFFRLGAEAPDTHVAAASAAAPAGSAPKAKRPPRKERVVTANESSEEWEEF